MTTSKFIILITSPFFLTSCEKLVEIAPPEDYLVSSTVFENDETAISAVTGLYATMMKSDYPLSYNIPLFTGLSSDELDYHQSLTSILTIYKYAINAKDAHTNQIWTNGFNYVYQANSVIEGLHNSTQVTPAVRNQLLGEALFIRSFWNYYLSNLYGSLPIILTTDYQINSKLIRSSIELVRNHTINDLLEAKKLLSEKYVAANSITESPERIRPNTFTASALLARIYLEMGNYSKAEIEATHIISNNKYELSDIVSVFKRTSKEAIWQLELPIATNFTNSYEANYFTLLAQPSGLSTQRCATISPTLLSLFNQKDKRRTSWINAYTDNTVTPSVKYEYPAKYKTRSTPIDEYTTPFRLAEIYLIRAEARAELGHINEAVSDADKIRIRAGLMPLSEITPFITKPELVDSISIEKRRELFCEWGIRWFDIKRSSKVNEIMTNIASQKSSKWTSNAILWPIPLNDILNSGRYLEQNEGYD